MKTCTALTTDRFNITHPFGGGLLVCVFASACILASHGMAADSAPSLRDRSLYHKGRMVYEVQCMPCHGMRGKGDGDLVNDAWHVPPRDFTRAEFKFRSTPWGKLPLDEDLIRTIRQGLPGTAMPAFEALTRSEVRAVVEYLKFFSRAWREASNYAPAVMIPERPGWFEDPVQHVSNTASGRELFESICAACHGREGRGGSDPGALVWLDAQGNTVQASDLTRPLRCGEREEDWVRTFLTGINGTPMPGFDGVLSGEDAWRIAAFLRQLRIPLDAGAFESEKSPRDKPSGIVDSSNSFRD